MVKVMKEIELPKFSLVIKQNCKSKIGSLTTSKCGEDSFFINYNGSLKTYFFGVADGVGGYRQQNIDPGKYSAEICKLMNKISFNTPFSKFTTTLKFLVYQTLKIIPKTLQGGTTLVSAKVDGNTGVLDLLNIGDSGCLILRPQPNNSLKCVFKSKSQQNSFNAPVHIYNTAESINNYSTVVQISDTYTFQLEKGDIIILATDGLFDNLFLPEIIDCIQPLYKNLNSTQVQKMVDQLLKKSKQVFTRRGPWVTEAIDSQLVFPTFQATSKEDDTTIIISLVV